jgi:hypothetical protein
MQRTYLYLKTKTMRRKRLLPHCLARLPAAADPARRNDRETIRKAERGEWPPRPDLVEAEAPLFTGYPKPLPLAELEDGKDNARCEEKHP